MLNRITIYLSVNDLKFKESNSVEKANEADDVVEPSESAELDVRNLLRRQYEIERQLEFDLQRTKRLESELGELAGGSVEKLLQRLDEPVLSDSRVIQSDSVRTRRLNRKNSFI